MWFTIIYDSQLSGLRLNAWRASRMTESRNNFTSLLQEHFLQEQALILRSSNYHRASSSTPPSNFLLGKRQPNLFLLLKWTSWTVLRKKGLICRARSSKQREQAAWQSYTHTTREEKEARLRVKVVRSLFLKKLHPPLSSTSPDGKSHSYKERS